MKITISLLFTALCVSNSLFAQAFDTDTSKPCINSFNQIDSLIVVKKINDKSILVMFGSDAITAIKTQEGIVVIDAGISTGLTSKYKEVIKREFQSNKFFYVINTHSHPDHNGGNSVFGEAKVIGQENGLREISEQWANSEKIKKNISAIVDEYELKLREYAVNTKDWHQAFTQKARYCYALKDAEMLIPIKRPDITFSDSLQINIGNIRFEMIYFGKCHSNSDILIYVPGLKILMTGDLFFKYGRPSINDATFADKEKWKTAIKWIEKRIPDIETMISGHGAFLSVEDLKNFNNIIIKKCLN